MNKALILTVMIMSGTSMIACNSGGDSGGSQPASASTTTTPMANPEPIGTTEAPLITGAELTEKVQAHSEAVAGQLGELVSTGIESEPIDSLAAGQANYVESSVVKSNSTAPASIAADPNRYPSGFTPASAGR